MKLIGMLDSPYVRRTAISLKCLGINFEHEAVSVFKHFAHFQTINPVVKAPTWQFIQSMLAEILPAEKFPQLQALSQYAETLPEFRAFPPTGPGV